MCGRRPLPHVLKDRNNGIHVLAIPGMDGLDIENSLCSTGWQIMSIGQQVVHIGRCELHAFCFGTKHDLAYAHSKYGNWNGQQLIPESCDRKIKDFLPLQMPVMALYELLPKLTIRKNFPQLDHCLCQHIVLNEYDLRNVWKWTGNRSEMDFQMETPTMNWWGWCWKAKSKKKKITLFLDTNWLHSH